VLKSIRWTLQLWHAGILVLALTSFGAALYVAADRTTYTAVDRELAAAARVFADPQIAPQQHSLPAVNPDATELAMAQAPKDSPGSGNRIVADAGSGNPALSSGHLTPAGPGNLQLWSAQIPTDCLRRIGWDEGDQPYFIVWGSDGAIVRQSDFCPNVPVPVVPVDLHAGTTLAISPPEIRERDGFREVAMSGPFGSTVLIGRSVAREEAGLRSLRWSLAGVGLAILAVGLLGGVFLSDRAIRPIQLITATAQLISATDLSRRIDSRETKSELGALARTLNDTFDRLEAAFQRERQFTADASHELRTPLSVIHMHSELALTKPRTPEEYRQAIRSSLRASTRMKSLVESLLVLVRADSGAMELNFKQFDLGHAVQECLAMVSPIAQERNVTVSCEGEGVSVEADRGCILQLITNLVSNAILYNRPGGSVTVVVSADTRNALMEIRDTGVGISPADQPNVFRRFFRTANARSRESGGSGLGLAICQSIAAAHRGNISFTSELGEGTTFSVRLPILSSRKVDVRE
jgi:heavy metal sensor kinase